MVNIVGKIGLIIAKLATNGLDPNKEYVCEIKEKREKRSLNANDYYWKLNSQFADYNKVSKIRQHNENLMHYGQAEMLDGKPVHILMLDTDKFKDSPDIHLCPFRAPFRKDGKMYRDFILLRGSHTYDSYEMSVLIDGLINEIKGSGAHIETMTPRELANLKGYGDEVK